MRLQSTALALIMAAGAAPALAQSGDTYCVPGDTIDTSAVFEWFDRLDSDNDSRVTVSEYGRCLDDAGVVATDRERYLAGFQEWDADDDDIVVVAEVEAAYGIDLASASATTSGMGGEQDIISIADWRYDELYREGVSARDLMDGDVYGVTGEEIGEVEDIIASQDGRILAVVAEVGGFWDIGDTHVSVPWEDVEVGADGIILPVTEETVEDFGIFDREYLTAEQVDEQMVGGVDDARVGPNSYRLSELIGDYARLRGDADTYRNYGYVRDVIIQGGTVDAVVVSPSTGLGVGAPGYRAYPYYGYGVGYGPYYDMPYGETEIGDVEAFDYDAMAGS